MNVTKQEILAWFKEQKETTTQKYVRYFCMSASLQQLQDIFLLFEAAGLIKHETKGSFIIIYVGDEEA